MAFDTLTGARQSIQKVVAGIVSSGAAPAPAELHKNTTSGFVLGAGLDLHAILHFSPELRYTHWGSQHFVDAVNGLLHSNQSQIEFLLGITF